MHSAGVPSTGLWGAACSVSRVWVGPFRAVQMNADFNVGALSSEC